MASDTAVYSLKKFQNAFNPGLRLPVEVLWFLANSIKRFLGEALPLKQQNPFFHGLATHRTLLHAISAKLTCAMTAQEYQVFLSVHANWAQRLKRKEKEK